MRNEWETGETNENRRRERKEWKTGGVSERLEETTRSLRDTVGDWGD